MSHRPAGSRQTSFASPKVTIGRMFSGTFAGIAPACMPAYIAVQGVGALLSDIVLPWPFRHQGRVG